MNNRTYRALGLMSGTSLDGIDAAILTTDGEAISDLGAFLTVPYPSALRERLRRVLGGKGPVPEVEREMTEAHADIVARLLGEAGLAPADVDVIGFHGHTILHEPARQRTWQIGDGALLAKRTGIDVVCDFRSNDMDHGGEGAPMAPLYHRAFCAKLEKPVAVLNIGGVANVTWIGPGDENGGEDDGGDAILAFDTGPGNALIDDWVLRHTGRIYDTDGQLARSGRVDDAIVERYLSAPYFSRRPPKSLDRLDFTLDPVDDLSNADGAATLAAVTCEAAARAAVHFPAPAKRWLVTGGGRHNPVLMDGLARRTGVPVEPVEAVGQNGDALEAHAFAYLAVRSLRGLPLSVPGTTGVREPVTGGRLHRAPK